MKFDTFNLVLAITAALALGLISLLNGRNVEALIFFSMALVAITAGIWLVQRNIEEEKNE